MVEKDFDWFILLPRATLMFVKCKLQLIKSTNSERCSHRQWRFVFNWFGVNVNSNCKWIKVEWKHSGKGDLVACRRSAIHQLHVAFKRKWPIDNNEQYENDLPRPFPTTKFYWHHYCSTGTRKFVIVACQFANIQCLRHEHIAAGRERNAR